jgi:ribose/xylose/arabinose/galactoside ABC-type transport system permease subunit
VDCGIALTSTPRVGSSKTTIEGSCAMGAINGGMIAYGKTRPFLTTLVVLIILRGAYNKATAAFTDELASINSDSSVWDFMGSSLPRPWGTRVLDALAAFIILYDY